MATSQGKSGTTAHSEADGGHKAAFPPFEKDTFASQLVSFAIAFALLYIVVSKLALPRGGGILATRQAAIDGDLNEAARLKNESDAALKAYETELADARAKSQAIAGDVRDKLNAEQEQQRKLLEDRLTAQLDAAEATIATTRTQAMGNVSGIAADAASAIVERLTGVNPNAGAVNAALDASLKR